MKKQSFFLVLTLFLIASAWTPAFSQPTYEEFKSAKGEVLYRYTDGYTISKKDFDESERLRISADDKWDDKNYSGALRDAEAAVRLNQKNYKAWSSLGDAKSKQNQDYDGAIADYTKSIELNSKYDFAWYNRGYVKDEKGDFNGAIADYNVAIRLNPHDADYWYNRGLSKGNKGDYDGEISDYTESIRLEPNLADVWLNRGLAKRNKSNYDGAIADYNEAIRLQPDDADAWNNRGVAKEIKGQLDEAIKDYKKALELDPNYEIAKDNLRLAEANLAALRPQRLPTVHVLAVGIGRYQQDFALSPLEFTVPGAYQVKNLFERRGLTRRVPLLNDSKARRRAILDSLEALTNTRRVLPDDLVIFYFSGHGLLAGGKLGICPYDYQTSADLIEDKTITEILNRCPARHKICLIEACKNETSADVLDPVEVRRFNDARRNLTAGVVYMTSTEVGKKSWGNAEGGYFTVAVIEGLDDGKADSNADRSVTAQELFDYVKKTVSGKTNSQQVPQINSGYPQLLEVMKLPR